MALPFVFRPWFGERSHLWYHWPVRNGSHNRLLERRAMVQTYVLAVISILLLATGQALLKWGLAQAGGVSFSGGAIWAGFKTILTSPIILSGFAFYGASSLIWLDVLSKLELSKAFPMVALTYVITLFVGGVFFNETITFGRVLGVLVIIGGVALVARS